MDDSFSVLPTLRVSKLPQVAWTERRSSRIWRQVGNDSRHEVRQKLFANLYRIRRDRCQGRRFRELLSSKVASKSGVSDPVSLQPRLAEGRSSRSVNVIWEIDMEA